MLDTQVGLRPFAELLRDLAGLDFPQSRANVLRRAIEQRMEDVDVANVGTYLGVVVGDEHERQRLLELATVGETYFFRHREQLDMLRTQLARLIAHREASGKHRLRLWSAGCATGEESYTLAVMSFAMLTAAEWDLRVVGTDIDERALRRARAGRYASWSFRSPLGADERWFPVSAKHRTVAEPIRRLVRFERHNLASDLPSLPRALGGAPDVVLCRNVLMYLEPLSADHVLEGIFDALAPDGLLLVAPVEAAIPGLARFERHSGKHATLYRRPRRPRSVSRASARPPSPRATERRAELRPGRPTSPPPSAANKGATRAMQPVVGLDDVRALADRGALDTARARCQDLVRHAPSIDAFLLLATIAEATDDLAGAAAALRGACYLDGDHAGAQFRLGLVEWRQGATRRARVRLIRAVELTASCADDEEIAPIGMSAARLRSIAGTMTR